MSAKFFASAVGLLGAASLAAYTYRKPVRSASGGLAGRLDAMPRAWWRKPPPKPPGVCYRSKSEALRQFVETNQDIIQNYGGIDYPQSPAEFDAINHKYDLRGKRAARTIAQAIWAAMPSGRPYCLDQIDLDALNGTSPAREADQPFRLPDYVYDIKAAQAQMDYYQQAARD